MIERTQFNFAQRWQVITKPEASTTPKQMMGWIMAGIIILCVLGAIPWVWELKLQYDVAAMNTKIAVLHPVEVKIQKLNAAKAKVQSQKQLSDLIQKEDHDPAQVLAKLIPLLPTGVTIQSFSYAGDTVSVAVTAPNPIDVARLWLSLRDSKSFQVTDLQSISLADRDQSYVLALKYSDSAKLNIPAGAIVPGSLPGTAAGEGSPAGGVFTLPGQSNLGDLWLAPGGTDNGATGGNNGTGSPASSSNPPSATGSTSPSSPPASTPSSSSPPSVPPEESTSPSSPMPPSSPSPPTPQPESSPPQAPGNTTTVTPSLPAAPLGLTVQLINNSQVNLHWEQIAGADAYAVYRKDGDSTDYKLLALVSGNSYSDNIILPGSYYYRVSASTHGQEGDQSLPIEVTISSVTAAATESTSIISPIPLNKPHNVTAAAVGTDQIQLTWAPVTNANGYRVYRATDPAGPYWEINQVSEPHCTDVGLIGGISYSYRITAINMAGYNSGYSDAASAVTALPGVPAGLKATTSGKALNLTWNMVPGATLYKVWRAPASSRSYTELGTTTELTFTDTTAKGDQSYLYQVSALSSYVQDGSPSRPVSASVPAN